MLASNGPRSLGQLLAVICGGYEATSGGTFPRHPLSCCAGSFVATENTRIQLIISAKRRWRTTPEVGCSAGPSAWLRIAWWKVRSIMQATYSVRCSLCGAFVQSEFLASTFLDPSVSCGSTEMVRLHDLYARSFFSIPPSGTAALLSRGVEAGADCAGASLTFSLLLTG